MDQLIIHDKEKRIVKVDQGIVLGSGGEGIVFKDPDYPRKFAIKGYHNPNPIRERKIREFISSKFDFKERRHIVIPLYLVESIDGKFFGFEMYQLPRKFRKISEVFKKSFCDTFSFNTKVITDLFLKILDDLSFMHQQGIIIGDLNSGGIMVHEDKKDHAWVDMDSPQFKNHICSVGTQLYLSPDLYGIRLDQKPFFKEHHDWYSFSVLLFQALLNGIHPFKSGNHKEWKGIEKRALNKATVLDIDVTYPKKGFPPEVLTDELSELLVDFLKRNNQNPFPKDALQTYADTLVECKNCGMCYPGTRKQCPGCTHHTILDADMAAKMAGIDVREMINTDGKILHVQLNKKSILCITEESESIFLYKKEDIKNDPIKIPLNIKYQPGMQFGIFQTMLVICPDPANDNPELYIFEIKNNHIKPVKQTTTSSFSGRRAVWGTSNYHLYRTVGRTLKCIDLYGSEIVEREVMQVYEDQTWFTANPNPKQGREMLLGFHRNFSDIEWFLIVGDGESFKRYENLNLQKIKSSESMKEFSIRFDEQSAALIRKVKFLEKGTWIEKTLVDIISSENGNCESYTFFEEERFEEIHGKAFFKNFIMHPTDDSGIIRENLKKGKTSDLIFTAKYVSKSDKLFPFGPGILIQKSNKIILITLNK